MLSIAHATLVARDPVPVVPETGTRVAFLTTFVPGKEPLEMVRGPSKARCRIRHPARWTSGCSTRATTTQVKALCAELGVHHFTRKGVPEWNQPEGAHRARTKHGNYNAWLATHGDDYDFFASVDTDHVPLPNFLERMLGFFRDPDVALRRRPAGVRELRQLRHQGRRVAAVPLPRADPAGRQPLRRARCSSAPTTPYASAALKQIGGLYDSITEDMATGFEMHRRTQPAHGPAVALGLHAGRARGRRGARRLDGLLHPAAALVAGDVRDDPQAVLEGLFTLPPGRLFNYTLMIVYYPMSALNWILAALSCVAVPGLGASGVQVDPSVWLMLYGDASALQIGLYIWNRRHNVSPARAGGLRRAGGHGDVRAVRADLRKSLSDAAAAPQEPVRRHAQGRLGEPGPAVGTFRVHLCFVLIFGGSLVRLRLLGHTHAAMLTWATFAR